MPRRKKQGAAMTILTVLIAVVIVIVRQSQSPPTSATAPTGDEAAIIQAYSDQRSNIHVEINATVTKLLPDDDDADAHQRFIVRITGFDKTILISHNIDLAPRVPVRPGDAVRIKGEYEWSAQGGVIHWTHRNPNPNPRHPGGWIEHNQTRYE